MSKKTTNNSNDVATHNVVIDFEGGKKEVFDAVIDFSDEDTRLYKLVDGELKDDTYIEIRNDVISIVVDDLGMEVDLLDFTIEGASFHLSCEEFDCASVEIDTRCICDGEDEIANILANTPPFGEDENDWYTMLFGE
jgi:hypothetical protein